MRRDRIAQDENLVLRVSQGDEAAFREMYDGYSRFVGHIVFSLLGNDCEADDVLQETFLEVFRSIGGLRDPSRLRPWIGTIAVRCAYRRLKNRIRHRTGGPDPEELPQKESSTGDPLLIGQFREALDALPLKLQVPFVLHAVDELPMEQVAVLCEVSLATVKRRIAKATKRLQKRLSHARAY
ncbi:RNA polymerase sigma factor [Myxococcota bacterium]|nr:RNA polymerase sigma factor [Myxococcota bacterium]MBU1536436.1 RNA polymerase sigma factor [Myxococcota bacterium]